MFESYRNRISRIGNCNIDALENQSIATKEILFNNSRSYKEVIVDGKKYDARIISDVQDTVKTGDGNYVIEFRNNILFHPGTYVQIPSVFNSEEYEYWLIMDIIEDFNPQFLIKKCVYELKWKNSIGNIVSRWITFDDSYKIYDAIRNYGYKTNLPESSIVIRLPLDDETKNIRLDKRFILDLEGTEEVPDVYSVANRSALSKHLHGHGIIELALSKTQFNYKTDNSELMVADYYDDDIKNPTKDEGSERAEIVYNGKGRIVMGTPYKEFSLKFYDIANQETVPDGIKWDVLILPEFKEYFTYVVENDVLKIKASYNENLQSYKFKIIGSNSDGSVSTEMYVKVVSGI